jgi:hypothetical protein
MSAIVSGESGGGLERDVWADGRSQMCRHRVTRGARATTRDVPAENVVILRSGDFIIEKEEHGRSLGAE